MYGEFLWPVDAWVSADEIYANGEPHSGTADLSAPYWLPVGASRHGTVVSAGLTSSNSYGVRIDHGDGYQTGYGHLAEEPLVAVDDVVEANEVIGYVGRTGQALAGGAHVHFVIRLDDERIVVDIEHGQWVTRGQPIPGEFAGIEPIELPQTPYEVRITEPLLSVHTGPAQDEDIVGAVLEDEVVTVTQSYRGYYRIDYEGDHGWIVHAGTLPLLSEVFGVQVVSGSADVSSEPTGDAEVVDTLDQGTLVTVFDASDDYYRILNGFPALYTWIDAADTELTPEFRARIRSGSAAVRSGPGIDYPSIGSHPFFEYVTVLGVEGGWYLHMYEGEPAWVAGWLTSGRL